MFHPFLAAALVAAAAVCAGAIVSPAPLMTYSGSSHYDFGVSMGRQMSELIANRYRQSTDLSALRGWASTPAGAAWVAQYKTLHESLFPDYMQEIQGIADGSGQAVSDVFLMNLDEELSYFLNGTVPPGARSKRDHCSDYALHSADGTQILDGHNEDGGIESVNNTFIVNATINGASFVAYVYAGDLPSGAFGINSYGIGFTLNYVQPVAFGSPGVGRGFISRSLLDAVSAPDAMTKINVQPQGAGHNVQLFDFVNKNIVDVETAVNATLTTPVTPGSAPVFHANVYIHLNISQVPDVNSQHRMDRAKQLPPPTNAKDILSVLGDTTDPDPAPHHTIYQQGPDLFTLATALFDLNACTVTVVTGNPSIDPTPVAAWTVPKCSPAV